jgi:MFS transporter, FHS family, L-fucose permease
LTVGLKTVPIFLAFFLMGLADAMGPSADKIQKHYEISYFISTLLPFVVFIAFAVFSVPGGVLAARIGKKKLLLLGLGLNAAALVIPSVMLPTFPVLLGCIFVLGVGTTFLQVSGNPIMRDVSAEGQYSRNLAFAQGIKGIGSCSSTYLMTAIASIALFKSMDWRAGFPFFLVLMILAFFSVASLKVDETKVDAPPSIGSSLSLLTEPIFYLAVLGIFLYVGAEQCMARFLAPALQNLHFDKESASSIPSWLVNFMPVANSQDLCFDENSAKFYGPTMFYMLLTVGRLLGGALLTIMSPRTCFRLSALLGVVGALALLPGSKALTFAGIIAAGLGFANIWPMLFSITVEEKPQCANELSGLMCMAISGGAVVPLVMGLMLDQNCPIAMAFVVPTACFGYLLLISVRGRSTTAMKGAAA